MLAAVVLAAPAPHQAQLVERVQGAENGTRAEGGRRAEALLEQLFSSGRLVSLHSDVAQVVQNGGQLVAGRSDDV